MTLPEPLHDEPPAAKLVYRELDDAGHPISYGDLGDRLALDPATVSRALRLLECSELVTSHVGDDDERTVYYEV